MTVTTTYRQDFLGRWIANAQPGTTADPVDYLGRPVLASNKDFLGRPLIIDGPAAWATGTEYAKGALVSKKTVGGDYDYVAEAQDAGTSHGSTEPTWPGTLGGTVVDNSGANQITWMCVHT